MRAHFVVQTAGISLHPQVVAETRGLLRSLYNKGTNPVNEGSTSQGPTYKYHHIGD